MNIVETEVQILAHSKPTFGGDELITVFMRYPYFIHAQILRHRSFAHSVQSFRAINYERIRAYLMSEGFAEVNFYAEQKGMAAGPIFDENKQFVLRNMWLKAMIACIRQADELKKYGVHHAIINRLLLPFVPIAHIMTGTRRSWDYFLSLRLGEDVEPHTQHLAYLISDSIQKSSPIEADVHVPFGERNVWVAVAKCAKISYLNYDRNIDEEDAVKFCKKLWNNKHYSPFEHVAVERTTNNIDVLGWNWISIRNDPGYVETYLFGRGDQ